MKTRAITGLFFIAVMLGSFFAGHYVFAAFYLLLSLLCLQEFYKLVKQAGINPNVGAGILNAGLLYVAFALLSYSSDPTNVGFTFPVNKLVFLLPVTMGSILALELFKEQPNPFTHIAYTFWGIIFAVVPFCFFHALAYVGHSGFNFHIPLAFMLMLWANDTGAYLTGRWLGRTKLFERHSPKKTWEGFIGGVLISAVVAFIISRYYPEMSWRNWVSMAIIIGVVGTTGDLVESMFKRSINIKDSGGILPGHGGLLDRFDGLLLACPVVFAYLYFVLN
ncbi:phosphatidate cytidylyltransferase [Mucilaginibacter robiniae]|uniref:Phosphatidate cytidylyltransferase n=1 Tax=Mucilaginibacter robiniae TaxID=2728022 RepID=A0A7L5E3T5_9SPHI|nr:phosphatidate cytidylyltransferase [Mucilaginibacter robiniae]QJD96344.1 phosphatidate cytidylyltransferase [Mucilaginibacter robiniae]